MAKLETKFASESQEWETPPEVFDPLNQEFRFTLDACATSTNKKVGRYFCKEDDGTKQSWMSETVWINPPYGDSKHPLSLWVKKAYMESRLGATCVLLIPARTNTNWFHDICLKHGEVRFVRGRPKFNNGKHGLPQPLCIVVFKPAPPISERSRGE